MSRSTDRDKAIAVVEPVVGKFKVIAEEIRTACTPLEGEEISIPTERFGQWKERLEAAVAIVEDYKGKLEDIKSNLENRISTLEDRSPNSSKLDDLNEGLSSISTAVDEVDDIEVPSFDDVTEESLHDIASEIDDIVSSIEESLSYAEDANL